MLFSALHNLLLGKSILPVSGTLSPTFLWQVLANLPVHSALPSEHTPHLRMETFPLLPLQPESWIMAAAFWVVFQPLPWSLSSPQTAVVRVISTKNPEQLPSLLTIVKAFLTVEISVGSWGRRSWWLKQNTLVLRVPKAGKSKVKGKASFLEGCWWFLHPQMEEKVFWPLLWS